MMPFATSADERQALGVSTGSRMARPLSIHAHGLLGQKLAIVSVTRNPPGSATISHCPASLQARDIEAQRLLTLDRAEM